MSEHTKHTKAAEGSEDRKKTQKKRRKKEKAKGFPYGGLLVMLLLVGVILASGYFGMQYAARYESLVKSNEERIAAAEAELRAAEAEYTEADPESDAHVAERRQVTEKMIASARAELESFRGKNEETAAAISELENRIAEYESAENFDYYMAIYEQYIEGRAYVEDLLSGD